MCSTDQELQRKFYDIGYNFLKVYKTVGKVCPILLVRKSTFLRGSFIQEGGGGGQKHIGRHLGGGGGGGGVTRTVNLSQF